MKSESQNTSTACKRETWFASPDRMPKNQILRQAGMVDESPLAKTLLNSTLNRMMILNACRQIVSASDNVLELTESRRLEELLGKRPGEALGCIHANDSEGGCGTGPYCRDCGSVMSVLEGLAGRQCTQECRMIRRKDGIEESLDLQVLASPLDLETQEESFTVLALQDISHEKRRRALERIFFHDVINLAGGMEGLLVNLKENAPEGIRSEVDLSHATLREIIEEIVMQRDLSAAEQNELVLRPGPTSCERVLQQTIAVYRNHPACQGRKLQVGRCDQVEFMTDMTLLRRVLGNLVKNAAEATAVSDPITIAAALCVGEVEFSVHNPQVMAESVQHQVFQRSFSTKGRGRGLGTYSVRLIGEKCLKGHVGFRSELGHGTSFWIRLPLTPV